ncbi:D-beta-hydroxybutyrate dehydrogenase [Fulvimarina pelagi HTCC2506]|uniref:D-beta-hydroxybutyrate dehydrogenase n=1 Tax=Fulvimarina pelagi HTCC2506 TaxID=314231 RepID=Q0G4C9_9HYPH|nr:SDR family oxidoreductase [Fulvimarina pelagi]EAU41552.1 D-beta-hydroxybutyrate dehydrogenase [Fulvimarina pelagi HTCC2506]
MHIDLSGKTALVTGSTAGIGLASAVGLAKAGAKVIINGRGSDRVEEAVRKAVNAAPGADISGVAADLSSAEGVDKLVESAGDVDILVNNVGIFGPQPFYEVDDATWEMFFQLNVMSGVRLSRALLPKMTQKGWGRIVFLSSESALNIPADMIHYGFTKTAVLSLSRGLAKFAAGTGVTVNSVLPGPTYSEGVENMLEDMAKEKGISIKEAGVEFVKSARPSSIIQRPAEVEEVANMVVYACSKEASATSGAALRVDGGVVDSIVP